MDKLPKPCPFCGKPGIPMVAKTFTGPDDNEGVDVYQYYCMNFNCILHNHNWYGPTKEAALKMWNHRVRVRGKKK